MARRCRKERRGITGYVLALGWLLRRTGGDLAAFSPDPVRMTWSTGQVQATQVGGETSLRAS